MSGTTAIQEGKRRYNAKVRRLSEKSKESTTLHGKYLYKKLGRYLNDAVEAFLKDATKGRAGYYHKEFLCLKELKTPVITHLSLTHLLDTLSKPQKRTQVAYKIGQKLLDEIAFCRLKTKHKSWWKTLHSKVLRRSSYKFRRALAIRAANQDFKDAWKIDIPVSHAVPLGITLIELIRTSTGLIKYEKRKLARNKTAYYVSPTEDTLIWVTEFHRRVSRLSPYFAPVNTVPPKWVSVNSGGYDLPSELNWSFVKRNTSQNYTNKNLQLAFSAANSLQEVGHQISERSLKVTCRLHQSDLLSELYVPSNWLAPEVTTSSRACQALIHSRRRKVIPKVLAIQNILTVAKQLKETFYFPVQADFRGRLYYVPKMFNPQGPDMAKGLIEFSTSKSVRGHEHWFLIGGANRFGIKGTFQDRQDWVIKNEKLIRSVAADPIANRSFWWDCESPIEFMQWCFEFNEWSRDRISFKTRLPVKLDHTASGLQIISLLRNDKELQRLTNLTGADIPVDIYQELLDSIRAKIINTREPELITWLSLNLDRKLIKSLTVMYMYGGTPHGMQKTVVEWYVQKSDDIFGREIYIQIGKLLNLYHEALDELSESPRLFMNDCRQLVKKDEVLSWESPSGFPVINEYAGQKISRIRTTVNGERVSFHLNKPTGQLSYRQARSAVAANKVHSYDAAILHHVLNNFKEPINALHDCYGVLPSDVEYLQQNLKEALTKIFSIDIGPELRYAVS